MIGEKAINSLIEDFLASMDVRQNTRDLYKKTLQYFVNWMVRVGVYPGRPTRADVIRYKEFLRGQNLASATIDNYLASVKGFFKWLYESGQYDDITVGVRGCRQNMDPKKEYIRQDQISKLLSGISKDDEKSFRDYALIRLISITGMRCIEASRLNIDDLSFEDGLYIVKILSKGRWEKRPLKITEGAYNAISDYLNIRLVLSKEEPLFTSLSGKRLSSVLVSWIIKTRLRAAGIDSPKITAHSLRHSAAINALKMGESIYTVQKMLGHSSVKTTEIYLRAIEAEESLNNPVIEALDNAYK